MFLFSFYKQLRHDIYPQCGGISTKYNIIISYCIPTYLLYTICRVTIILYKSQNDTQYSLTHTHIYIVIALRKTIQQQPTD